MADVSDVLNALENVISAICYGSTPKQIGGVNQPSLAGPVVKVSRGEPSSDQTDSNMAQPSPFVAVVTVNQTQGAIGRLTTRFQPDWRPVTIAAPTFTMTVARITGGATLAVDGAGGAGQTAIIGIAGIGYSYSVGPSDTPPTIAAGLLAAVATAYPSASVSGAVLTLPGLAYVTARVSTLGTSMQATRQQEIGITVKIYAPNFAARDAVASLIDAGLASTIRITLPDTSIAMLKYGGNSYDDKPEKALTFIRNLRYQVEFSTTNTMQSATIGAFDILQGDTIAGRVMPPIQSQGTTFTA